MPIRPGRASQAHSHSRTKLPPTPVSACDVCRDFPWTPELCGGDVGTSLGQTCLFKPTLSVSGTSGALMEREHHQLQVPDRLVSHAAGCAAPLDGSLLSDSHSGGLQ